MSRIPGIGRHYGRYLLVLLCLVGSLAVRAEGTLEVMTNSVNGVGLNISNVNSVTSGPYRDAPTENRLRFYLKAGERLHFGWNAYNRNDPTPTQVPVYYRIIRSSDEVEVVPPTLVTPGTGNRGYIPSFAAAQAGPDTLAGAGGYKALEFIPGTAGEYFIEIYQSDDGGQTALAAQDTVLVFFDFTVFEATPLNVKPGRVYSQGWSLLTYNPVSFRGDITKPMELNSFYGYTADSTIAQITFQGGFRPLAFVVYFNKYGADPTEPDWFISRQSKSQSGSPTTLANGYNVFINFPDPEIFPLADDPEAPVLKSITGCPGNYKLNVQVKSPGDLRLLLDLDGNPGYDAGTEDRYVYGLNAMPGMVEVDWDGLDGLGDPVSGNVQIATSSKLMRGRTNLPFFDAELNQYGFTVTTFSPNTYEPTLYWDDSQLGTDATCNGATNNNNTTPAGLNVSETGVSQYHDVAGTPQFLGNRAWDGADIDNPPVIPTTMSAGSGANTPALLCDDYGNFRILNTWFWTGEVSSTDTTLTVPNTTCSLPLTLLQFAAEKRGTTARLHWTTADEVRFRHFVVERSLDGRSYSSIGTVPGLGGARNQYSFSDDIASFPNNRLYYRLRQVDEDGSYRYSRVVVLQARSNGEFSVSGLANPVKDAIRFQLSAGSPARAQLLLSDATGRVLHRQTADLLRGSNAVELSRIGTLSAGLYFLSIEANGTRQVHKLVVGR
ncbi:T9SS type A sorting domain-containing protein [Flaviaesturariibacter amylovorans]|uniref:T9SS type A sorting domain-containing protein n=1 Tax=Flaviaesturariibacter amylovorans TaxID=1084520 RepID=A0ABP8HQV7_9BACT